jgi:NitT/TauT family transport system substrate-binding protein
MPLQTLSRRAFGAGLVSAAALSGPVFAQQPLTKVVMAAGGDGLHYSAIHIANAAGFFKEEGLELEIVDVNSGPRQAAALMGGSALFAPLGMIHEIKIITEGGSLVAASNLFAKLDIHVVISKDAMAKTGIKDDMPTDEKVKRMKGLRLGITSPGSTTDTNIRTIFKSRGLDPDQMVQLQPVGGGSNMLAAFEKGLLDGFVWSAPQPQVAVNRDHATIIIDPFRGDLPEQEGVPYLVMAINRDMEKKNADVLHKTMRALTKGMLFAHKNPDQALNYVQAHFPEFDKDVLKSVWKSYLKGIPQTPVISQDLFDNTQRWMNYTAKTPYKTKYEDVVSSAIARQVAKELVTN